MVKFDGEIKHNNARYWNLNLLESNETENLQLKIRENFDRVSIHTRLYVPTD